MSDVPAILTAAVGVLGATGAAGRFIWSKIEKRFDAVEADLKRCEERERASVERRAVQITVIELLWQEVKRLSPEAMVLTRAKHLLDDLKKEQRKDRDRDLKLD